MRYSNASILSLPALLILALAGCQSPVSDKPELPPAADAQPALPSGEADTCRASTYATLVGKDRKLTPPAPVGQVVRVVCTTCPMTMDFNAERLNIFYDAKTGIVTRLSCG